MAKIELTCRQREKLKMAFKKPTATVAVPESPDRLFRDLPRRRHPSLFDHQGQMLRNYVAMPDEAPG